MRLLVPALGITFAFLSGCESLQRDNPFDPANAPVASLVAYGPAGSDAEGPRSTLFTLDASGSSDPLGRGPLTFAWFVDDDGVPDAVTTGSDDKLTRTLPTPPFPSGGVGGGVRTVRVRVTAGDGAFAEATASVFITNRAPHFDLGEDLTVARNSTPAQLVTLDPCGGVMGSLPCLSSDPDDGDTLTVTWEQLRGDPVTLTTAGGVATFAAPPESQELLFRATMSDGLATATDEIRVRVGAVAWVSTIAPAGLFRVYPELALFDAGPNTRIVTAAADAETGEIWIAQVSPGNDTDPIAASLLHRRTSELAPVVTFDVGTGELRGIAAAGGSACLAVLGDATVPTGFYRIDAANMGTGPFVDADGNFPNAVYRGPEGGGDCWAIAAPRVYLLRADGSFDAIDDSLLDYRLSARDANGSLWTFQEGDAGATLKNIQVDGSITSYAVPFSIAPDALITHPGGGLWLHLKNSELLRFEGSFDSAVSELDAEVTFPGATNEYPNASKFLAGDPVEGVLWVSDLIRQRLARYRVRDGVLRRDGEVFTTSIVGLGLDDPFYTGVAVDPRGARAIAWGYGDAGGGLRHAFLSLVPHHLQKVRSVPFAGINSRFLATDRARGAVWVSQELGLESNGVLNGGNGVAVHLIADSGRVLGAIEPAAGDLGIERTSAVVTDADGTLRIAARSSSSVASLRHYDVGGAEIVADRIDYEDGSMIPIALDQIGPMPDGGVACATTIQQGFYRGFGPLLRLEYASGTVVQLAFALGATAASAGVDGSCWFVDSGSLNAFTVNDCTNPGGGVVRFAPNAGTMATPAAETSMGGGVPFDCPRDLAIDRRDGTAIVADTARIARVNFDGGNGGGWTAPGLTRTLDTETLCAGPEPGCSNVWLGMNDGTLRRVVLGGSTAVTELDRITFIGTPDEVELHP